MLQCVNVKVLIVYVYMQEQFTTELRLDSVDTPGGHVAVCCTLCCSVLQCVTVCYSVLQCVAVCVCICVPFKCIYTGTVYHGIEIELCGYPGFQIATVSRGGVA